MTYCNLPNCTLHERPPAERKPRADRRLKKTDYQSVNVRNMTPVELPFMGFVDDLHTKHRRVAVTEFANG